MGAITPIPLPQQQPSHSGVTTSATTHNAPSQRTVQARALILLLLSLPGSARLPPAPELLEAEAAARGCWGEDSRSFAFPVSLRAAASWEQLGSRLEENKIRKREKAARGAACYLTLSLSYPIGTRLLRGLIWSNKASCGTASAACAAPPPLQPRFPPDLPVLKIRAVSHLAVLLE